MGFAVNSGWLTGWQSGSRRIHLGGACLFEVRQRISRSPACCGAAPEAPATSGGYSLRYIFHIFEWPKLWIISLR